MKPDAATAHLDPETHWRTQVYVTGAPQLAVRAVIVGMLLGVVMRLSNSCSVALSASVTPSV